MSENVELQFLMKSVSDIMSALKILQSDVEAMKATLDDLHDNMIVTTGMAAQASTVPTLRKMVDRLNTRVTKIEKSLVPDT